MNTLDIILTVILLLFAVGGFRQGLIIGLATLVGLFLGIWAAVHFADFAGHILKDIVHLHTSHMALVSFLFTFLAVLILVFLLGKILETFIKIIALGFLNRLAGSLFGIAKGCLVLSALIYLLISLHIMGNLVSEHQRRESKLFNPVASIFPAILPIINKEIFEFKKPEESKPVSKSIFLLKLN